MSFTHAFEMIFTKQRIPLRKAEKFIQFLHENAPIPHYHTRVIFEQILLISLKDIFRFLKYNLYLEYVSR